MLQEKKSLLAPPPKLTVSEWADSYRIISQGNAEPGRWRTNRAPYQREPMDCISNPEVRQITLMWGAQTGKTDGLINNTIGYFIAQNPKSIMVMHPTLRDLQTWMEAKLTPLINDTPEVGARVAKPRSREGVNNQNMKSFPGGFLMFAYSGSPNTMRGRSAPIILCDEIDGYEVTSEGDPVNLLWQRAATFGDQRKLVVTSTPTIKGFSRIEKSYEASDMRHYFLPCPECGEMQHLEWGQVEWDKNHDGEHMPETARYVCSECSAMWSDSDKLWALRRGEWIAEKPFRGHAGFHLNELYSPWRKWRDVVESFLEKKKAGDLQTFYNVSLALTWEEQGEKADAVGLMTRQEEYRAKVPQEVLCIVAGIDVQDNRIELEVLGVGAGDETWSIEYHILYGDPAKNDVWDQLDTILENTYENQTGFQMRIVSACIDTGGHHTQRTYEFTKNRPRLHAIKGVGGFGTPLVSRPRKSNLGKVDLYSIGVDTVKELVVRRLRITEPGPGYCHFPKGPNYDAEYFEQLGAETLVTKHRKGRLVREWVKNRPRNEALDCRGYALAALAILNPNYKKIAEKIAEKVEKKVKKSAKIEEKEEVEQKLPVRLRRKGPTKPKRRGNYVNSWK